MLNRSINDLDASCVHERWPHTDCVPCGGEEWGLVRATLFSIHALIIDAELLFKQGAHRWFSVAARDTPTVTYNYKSTNT